MNWSCAVTVKLKAVPLLAFPGAETAKCVAVAAFTAMSEDVPLMEAVTVSLAVMVAKPDVLRVAEKFPAPFVSVEFAGRIAAPSLLVKCTVPV